MTQPSKNSGNPCGSTAMTCYIEPYYWGTDEPLSTNMGNMADYLENHLDQHLPWAVIVTVDGTYAEIIDINGRKFAINASGNGDFCNHKVEFEGI